MQNEKNRNNILIINEMKGKLKFLNNMTIYESLGVAKCAIKKLIIN